MGSLFEELEAREATARVRVRVDELEEQLAEVLAGWMRLGRIWIGCGSLGRRCPR